MCKWCNKEPKTDKEIKEFTKDFNEGRMCEELENITREAIQDSKEGRV